MRPFEPRLIRFHGVHDFARVALSTSDRSAGVEALGWRIKTYSVSHDASPIRWPSFEHGIRLALRALPADPIASGRPGLAFVVAHQGLTADYVILCWWDQENELPTRVCVKARDQVAWRQASERESFCVWDLEILWFEREAYVQTLLAPSTASDAAASYLARHLGVVAEKPPREAFALDTSATELSMRLATCEVRSWRASDAESLARYADNRKVWMNLRDAFPHPYTRDHAREFIRRALEELPPSRFAIAVDGLAVGGIGFVLHSDIERVGAEIGYWLAEPYWRRGITADAVRAVTAYAIEQHGLARVFAVPFARNTASCRVLEKAGYVLEGTMRRSAIKDGRIDDQRLYAFVV